MKEILKDCFHWTNAERKWNASSPLVQEKNKNTQCLIQMRINLATCWQWLILITNHNQWSSPKTTQSPCQAALKPPPPFAVSASSHSDHSFSSSYWHLFPPPSFFFLLSSFSIFFSFSFSPLPSLIPIRNGNGLKHLSISPVFRALTSRYPPPTLSFTLPPVIL